MQNLAVIGLGYVGLPLAVEFAKKGFSVIGIDTDKKRIASINRKKSYVGDVLDKDLKEINLKVTTDYSVLRRADAVIICVPTPLAKNKKPDVSYVIKVSSAIARYMVNPQLIILESTTYPGTTKELILPILSRGNKRVGRDFFLAYSPERVDPGNKRYTITEIPKIVAGATPSCLKKVSLLYRRVFQKVVPVSSTKVAETIKLLENIFRAVNIALVDEMAIMCNRMGIDIWEVIKGASTKPFGFMPFYPGPGLGGACLAKDPLYLAWYIKKRHNYNPRFIALTNDITKSMPRYIIDKLEKNLKKPVKDCKILILGVAYKKDVSDTRNSPSFDIIRILQKRGASIIYNDPYVPQVRINGRRYRSIELSIPLLKKADAVMIAAAHSRYDYKKIIRYSPLIFDTRGVIEGNNVVRL